LQLSCRGVLLFAVGCAKKEAKESASEWLKLKRNVASFGQSGGFGIQAAVDDINKQGGVQVGSEKVPIKLFFVDDESDPTKQAASGSLITRTMSNLSSAAMNAAYARRCFQACDAQGPLRDFGWSDGALLGMRSEAPEKWKYSWARA